MIYDIDQFDQIPELEESVRPPLSVFRKCMGWFFFTIAVFLFFVILLFVFVPIILIGVLLFLPYKLTKFIRAGGKPAESEKEVCEPEEEEPGSIETVYDEKTESLRVDLNYYSFRHFIEQLKDDIFGKEDLYTKALQEEPASENKDYYTHVHSGIGDQELLLGIDEGLFFLDGGTTIWASPNTWARAIDLMEEVLEKREEKMIVLDKYQTDWCESDSIGRFQIHYRPDFAGIETDE